MREYWWQQILYVCPDPLRLALENINNNEKTLFILNGLNSDYVIEWESIYIKCVLFVYKNLEIYESVTSMTVMV